MPIFWPESFLIFLNLFVLTFVYFFVYPRVAGSDSSALWKYDFIVSASLLIVVWFLYYWSGTSFTFLFFETNWFWFQMLLYFFLELPFYFYYTKQNWIKIFDKSVFNMAVDVVLELPEGFQEEVVEINKTLWDEIDFSKWKMTPHISLAMWYVAISDLKNVNLILLEYSDKFDELELEIKGFSKNDIEYWCWNSLELERSEQLISLFKSLKEELSPYFNEEGEFNYKVNDLTKSWVDNFYETKDENNFIWHISLWIWELTKKSIKTKKFKPTKLSLFMLWNFCTCREKIWEFEINKNS